ncbi:DUF7305 domain-containing protein [Psychromonas sp. Urea-02u-13]|uniref:DUF7305 domain-containing protein n=1 Tax=Psychromonas sp. Urea-02u-13 TaxID=2058326 RepID=UPI000C32AFAB|nr:hypothetical protein [Psychromonas sp. Urea-02u-13]PKG40780.1 hypothetical protein CXF74_01185 [Psychromonas sp. Urea-02u-13]
MVSGDIHSGGDLNANFNPVKQNAFVAGDASNTINIDGSVNHKGTISGDYNEALSKHDPTVKSNNVKTEACDKKGLAIESQNYGDFVSNGHFKPTSWQTQDTPFKFTANKADCFNSGYVENDPTKPLMKQYPASEIELLGETRSAHVYDNFHLNSRDITISGDVFIVVKNNFTMDGGGSQITIENGGSLTMVVAGKTKTISDAEIIEIPNSNGTVTSTNKSPMTLISAQKTTGNDVAVDLQGRNMNMTVDAPLGKVSMNAGGSFKGAILGKSVEVSGSGSIHYDEKLGSGTPVSGSGNEGVKFASVYYYYP